MTHSRTKTLVLSAVFIAVIFISITLLGVPNGLGGFIHFGDALIFIAAALLPKPFAMVVAALGPGLFNLVRGPQWFIFTIIIKPIMTLCFNNKSPKILGCKQNIIAPFAAGLINTGLYFIANIILFGGVAAGIAAVPALLIQGAGSVAFYFIIAAALDKLKIKSKLGALSL